MRVWQYFRGVVVSKAKNTVDEVKLYGGLQRNFNVLASENGADTEADSSTRAGTGPQLVGPTVPVPFVSSQSAPDLDQSEPLDLPLSYGEATFAPAYSTPQPGHKAQAAGILQKLSHVLQTESSDAGQTTESISSSETSDYISGLSRSGHYDPKTDTILRTEQCSEKEFKAVLAGAWFAIVIGFAALLVELTFKLTQDDAFFFRHQFLEKANVAFGGACMAACLACAAVMAHHYIIALRTGKRWSPRRFRMMVLYSVELALQIVNLAAFLTANIYSLAVSCGWSHQVVVWMSVVQWVCWNTILLCFLVSAANLSPWKSCLGITPPRHDAMLLDAPLWVHWRKLLIWLPAVLLNVALAVHRTVVPPHARVVCDPDLCTIRGWDVAIVYVQQIIIALFCAAFMYYIGRALIHLHAEPYVEYRMANTGVRMQARQRGTSLIFFVLSVALLFFVKLHTCRAYLEAFLGLLPIQVVMSTLAICNVYLAMPKDPKEDQALLQVWLQDFAWTEKDMQRKKALRSSYEGFPCMQREPMFCFETAIKMFYFCGLAYAFKQDAVSPFKLTFKLETAMALYRLDQYQLFWEKGLDTKCIMGWNRNTIVIAFRGTASFRNAISDLQAWRVAHPPPRGTWWQRPGVHRGFLRTWTYNRLNERVIDAVRKITGSADIDRDNFHCYVTGHSLGGALATLAAFDVRVACSNLNSMNISCYTYGAPRTGNAAWAKEFETYVPNMWHIINDQDLITRTGRLWGMYKRAGQRVIINARGDLIVRPSFLEAGVQRNPGGSSVAQHLLINYRRSLLAVIEAQFGRKRFRDGIDGILHLLESCQLRKVLSASGVALERLDRKLDHYARWGSLPDSRKKASLLNAEAEAAAEDVRCADENARLGDKLLAEHSSADEDSAKRSQVVDVEMGESEADMPRIFPEQRCVDTERGVVDLTGHHMTGQQQILRDSV